MAIKGRAFLYLRGAMIFLALLLPMISLMPLGWLWLWERGYALYWLAAAFSLAIAGYVAQVITLRKTLRETAEPDGKDAPAMKLRNPRLIRIVAWGVAGLIGVWTRTLRYRLEEETRARHPADPSRERFIYAFWHESILAMVGFRVAAHVLISQHADGELIARACEHLGFGTVRGSTTRGGGAALVATGTVAVNRRDIRSA